MVSSGTITYFGGNFTYAGATSSAELVDGTGGAEIFSTGKPNTTLPDVNGTVYTTLPDGSGGWYIGGDFADVGGNTDLQNLAHINPDGTADATWTPKPSDVVRTMVASGTTLYVGGDFTTIGEVPEGLISVTSTAGIEITLGSGALDMDGPKIDGNVNAAVPDGSGGWYVGGVYGG
jgi:hypothetical protein